MTRAEFLAAYEAALRLHYPTWTSEPAKLERFMSSVRETLQGPTATWNHQGDAVTVAWRNCGGKGKPTLKALRALPVEEPHHPDCPATDGFGCRCAE